MKASKLHLIIIALAVLLVLTLFLFLEIPLKDKLQTMGLCLLLGYVYGSSEYERTKQKPDYTPVGLKKITHYIVNPILIILTIGLFPPFIYKLVELDLEDLSYYVMPFIAAFWASYLFTMQICLIKKSAEYGEA